MSFGSGNQPSSYGATNPRYGVMPINEMQPPGNGDFYQLCDGVSSNIFAVNNSASTLEKALKQVGSPNDSGNLRDKIHDTQQITNSTISGTTRSLKTLSSYASNGDRQQRLHIERLRNEFQETVKRYSNLQKKVAEKIKSHYLSAKPKSDTAGAGATWGEAVEDDDDDSQQLLVQEQKQLVLHVLTQIQAQQQEIEFDAAMIAERESRVRQIEADILDVNQIFRDLGTMVHEQGEIINSIEGNIEVASHEVNSGREQLHKASQYQFEILRTFQLGMRYLLLSGESTGG
ncbi:Syntaxin-7 [Nymphon striatum]|nr:Syntaxin-7 [Nymphon striatum]